MDTPQLGESVCNGEAIVIAKQFGLGKGGRGTWYVLAMRPGTEDDQPNDSYVTWEYLGDGRVTQGEYFKEIAQAAVDLRQRAGYDVWLEYPSD